MRASSANDTRSGNNYRYQRAMNEEKDKIERRAQNKKSDDFYEKIGVLSPKARRSAQK